MTSQIEVFNSIPLPVNQSFFGWEELQVKVHPNTIDSCPNSIADRDLVEWVRSLRSKSEKRKIIAEIAGVNLDDIRRGRMRILKEVREGRVLTAESTKLRGRSLLESMLDVLEAELDWEEKVEKTRRSSQPRSLKSRGRILRFPKRG